MQAQPVEVVSRPSVAKGQTLDALEHYEEALSAFEQAIHTDRVSGVAISPGGQTLVSGSWDNTIKAWNLSTGKEVRTLTGHSGAVSGVAISAEGQVLVSGSKDNTIKVWSTQ